MNQQNESDGTPIKNPPSTSTPSTSSAARKDHSLRSASSESNALLLNAETSKNKQDQELEIIQMAIKLIEDVQKEATDHVSDALEEARELLSEIIMTPSLSSTNSSSLAPGDESSGQSPCTATHDESQKSQSHL